MKFFFVIILLIMGCTEEKKVMKTVTKKKVEKETSGFMTLQRQPSADMVEYQVIIIDSIQHPFNAAALSPYERFPGIATFRGGPFRDMPLSGLLDSIPTTLHIDWIFKTSGGKFGEGVNGKGRGWGGGAGWTGQPCLKVDTIKHAITLYQGSLGGKVFRLDYATGIETDSALDIP